MGRQQKQPGRDGRCRVLYDAAEGEVTLRSGFLDNILANAQFEDSNTVDLHQKRPLQVMLEMPLEETLELVAEIVARERVCVVELKDSGYSKLFLDVFPSREPGKIGLFPSVEICAFDDGISWCDRGEYDIVNREGDHYRKYSSSLHAQFKDAEVIEMVNRLSLFKTSNKELCLLVRPKCSPKSSHPLLVMDTCSELEGLPDEVLMHITSILPNKDIFALATTSRLLCSRLKRPGVIDLHATVRRIGASVQCFESLPLYYGFYYKVFIEHLRYALACVRIKKLMEANWIDPLCAVILRDVYVGRYDRDPEHLIAHDAWSISEHMPRLRAVQRLHCMPLFGICQWQRAGAFNVLETVHFILPLNAYFIRDGSLQGHMDSLIGLVENTSSIKRIVVELSGKGTAESAVQLERVSIICGLRDIELTLKPGEYLYEETIQMPHEI
eukprot:Plantae.Rhodophyta-Purpureofilum_apyrenoidigerum.ctg10179.p1 GENE.Plantae.Rhodophyta-Purpureofilum_apyrenoidigerum.ctg10179~~Plantae.Rhodophyta-Purpureofilum_apyrenoidigerum.ctg10179.p1  ORF type:complete len:441 (+),score=70.25 Plantae.Rhodophyta-Purpureofilum_apyrenoidigerum.ctg10179:56-1378(+)